MRDDEERGERPIYRDVWRLVGATSLAGALAVLIEHFSRGAEGACTASNATLAAECGVTERAVTRALERLRAAGVLEEVPTHRTKRRRLVRPSAPPTDGSGVPPTVGSGVTEVDPRPTEPGPPTDGARTPDRRSQDPRPYGHPRKAEEGRRKAEEAQPRAPEAPSPSKATRPTAADREAALEAFLDELAPETRAAVRDARSASRDRGPVAWLSMLRSLRVDASRRDEVLAAAARRFVERCEVSGAKGPRYLVPIVEDLAKCEPSQLSLGASTRRPLRTQRHGIIPLDEERPGYVFEPIKVN